MRERNIQIELTSKEVLLQSAACAISSVMCNHPELVSQMKRDEAEVFLHAALEITKQPEEWTHYLNKMMLICHNAGSEEGT